MRVNRIEMKVGSAASAVLERNAEDPMDRALVVTGERLGRRFRFEMQIDEGVQRQWEVAAQLQTAMEGRHGTQGDIAPYAHAIEFLADQ